ncbi:MAG TPA: tetratricopeptide repeat protein [Candidatus Obscuribacterales bacterium]
MSPTNYWAWYRRGDGLDRVGKYYQAIASFDKALEVRPTDYWAWYRRGEALRQMRRYQDAIACFDKALEIRPDDRNTLNSKHLSLDQLGKQPN